MTHYLTVVAVLLVLAGIAFAADADEHLRERRSALDDAADLCRGVQPDNTEDLHGSELRGQQKALVRTAKHVTRATNRTPEGDRS